MTKVLLAHPRNINRIVSHIVDNKIVAMPYGKKERRIFALLGLAEDSIISRMKKIKSRDASQGIAISGIPDVAPLVAKLDETRALVKAAKKLKITPQEVVEKCFQIGAVGLILMAQDWVPKGATMVGKKGQRTVLIAGEASNEKYDIFPKVYRYLIKKHNKVMVGTSANLHGENTYHILEQDEALNKLKDHIDLFIYDRLNLGLRPIFKHLTSTTMIDLIGERAKVVRWGSLHPHSFKNIFSDLIFEPQKLKIYQGREELYHLWLKKLPLPKGFLKS